ncbi:MAG TPA: hypothetical protein PKD61_06555, partial [Polyangiaceae bacterium]|nr:hypothetical protein [Polyangiaceae bacterium]
MDGAGAVSSGGAGASGGSSGTGGAGGSGNSGGLPCIGVNPAGCSSEGCAKDTVCDKLAGCAPTSCVCNGGVVLGCAKD